MQGQTAHLSLKERDRRYAVLRAALKERGVDCAVVCTSNLFYLTNGILGERLGLLPTQELPPTVTLHWRNLVDIPPDALHEIQGWVEDLRQGNDASALVERIRELRLEHGVIGLDFSSILGQMGLGHVLVVELKAAFPAARFVDISDIFINVRMIKSDEEIALIDRANQLFDAAVDRICERVRPGMIGMNFLHEGIKAMWEAGGDLNSTLTSSCGPTVIRQHVVQELSLARVIQPGDVAVLTGIAKYGGYTGHSDQQIVFGRPSALQLEMMEAVRFVRETVVKQIRPGLKQGEMRAAYQDALRETGFRPGPSDMHSYGIDMDERSVAPGAGWNDRIDELLQPGMVYTMSAGAKAPNSDDVVTGGVPLVVTENGYRNLGGRSVDLRALES